MLQYQWYCFTWIYEKFSFSWVYYHYKIAFNSFFFCSWQKYHYCPWKDTQGMRQLCTILKVMFLGKTMVKNSNRTLFFELCFYLYSTQYFTIPCHLRVSLDCLYRNVASIFVSGMSHAAIFLWMVTGWPQVQMTRHSNCGKSVSPKVVSI